MRGGWGLQPLVRVAGGAGDAGGAVGAVGPSRPSAAGGAGRAALAPPRPPTPPLAAPPPAAAVAGGPAAAGVGGLIGKRVVGDGHRPSGVDGAALGHLSGASGGARRPGAGRR